MYLNNNKTCKTEDTQGPSFERLLVEYYTFVNAMNKNAMPGIRAQKEQSVFHDQVVFRPIFDKQSEAAMESESDLSAEELKILENPATKQSEEDNPRSENEAELPQTRYSGLAQQLTPYVNKVVEEYQSDNALDLYAGIDNERLTQLTDRTIAIAINDFPELQSAVAQAFGKNDIAMKLLRTLIEVMILK